jgi:NAD(P)-dependent dehydrogenase (short-subunit alcohol dehydrogenase family)
MATDPARTHLVTGAASGIGLELADRLAARGDRVVRLTREVVDLEDAVAVARWATDFVEDLERLDSLLHVAGTVDLGTVAELDVSVWQRHLDVNLTAPAVLTAHLLPALRAAGGTVVFVNSSAGLVAHPSWSA